MGNLLFMFSLIIWASQSEADICSHLPGYSVHGTSCFKFYSVRKIWAAAEASCVADGGHLASIHSREEQDFVSDPATGAGPWIGLSGTAPSLTWSDGTEVDYENWFEAGPKAGDVGCSRLYGQEGHSWLHEPCSTIIYKYTCRIEPSVDQTQARFLMVPGNMATDPTVSPSSTQKVRSRVECAWRCQQDGGCVHFIMREDGGRYLCETYTTLYRASTPITPPTNNYQKIYP